MSELPKSWTETSVLSLCTTVRGVSFKKEQASMTPVAGWVSVLRANNIVDDRIEPKELIWVEPAQVSETQKLRVNDVVIAMSSGSSKVVGKTAQHNGNFTGSFGAFCGVLRPREEIDPKYFGYFFRSRAYRNEISALAAGTNINNIKREHFETIKVPLAPLNEQKRIVAKLDELLPKVEACKERLQKIPTILKRFRQSVLAAAVSGKLVSSNCEYRVEEPDQSTPDYGDIPAHWKMFSLSDLTTLITKGSSPTWQGIKYTDKGVLFITSENVSDGRLLMEEKTKYLEERFNDIQPRSILQKGDVLTNLVGASIGRCAIYDLDEVANINQAVAVIRTTKDLNNQFLMLVLNSPPVIKWMHQEKVDVARANLSLTQLNNLRIPLPDLKEQSEIIGAVGALLNRLQAMLIKQRHAEHFVCKVGDSILSKAFSGTLVSQDPTDEPASALLERIRSAAHQNNGKPKAKAVKRGRKSKEKLKNQEDRTRVAETTV